MASKHQAQIEIEDRKVQCYETLAPLYDSWNTGIETQHKLNFLKDAWTSIGHRPRLVLDLACGTGEISLALGRDGLNVVGLDLSPNMLEVARKKALLEKSTVEWVLGDMRTLNLTQGFDTVVCLHDSLNYILSEHEVKTVFLGVHKVLQTGGCFIFDLNTPYKLDKVFGSTVYAEDRGKFAYIWINSRTEQISCFDIRIFQHIEKDLFRRSREIHYQRSYERDKICRLLEQCGFDVHRVCNEFSLKKPTSRCLRESYIGIAR